MAGMANYCNYIQYMDKPTDRKERQARLKGIPAKDALKSIARHSARVRATLGNSREQNFLLAAGSSRHEICVRKAVDHQLPGGGILVCCASTTGERLGSGRARLPASEVRASFIEG